MAEGVEEQRLLLLEEHKLILQPGELGPHDLLAVLDGGLADPLLLQPLP